MPLRLHQQVPDMRGLTRMTGQRRQPRQTARLHLLMSGGSGPPAAAPPATVWSEDLCTRLAELRPDQYGGLDATTLALELKLHDVETRQLWKGGANRRGIHRADVVARLDQSRRPGGGPLA